MTRIAIALIALVALAGCSITMPFVLHGRVDGKADIDFDGRNLAVQHEGNVEVGIHDKAGVYIYPPGGPLKLTGSGKKGYDIKEKTEIPWAEVRRRLGLEASGP